MSGRQRLAAATVGSPQLRNLLDRPPVDLSSPVIRQMIREVQECQYRIRRFRRSGLVAWLDQGNRLNTIHNVHKIVGNVFEQAVDEIGLDAVAGAAL